MPPKPKSKSKLLFISEVPEYLYKKYGVRRTLRMVRKWITDGYTVKDKRVYLKMLKTYIGQQYTREEFVDEFIWKVGNR